MNGWVPIWPLDLILYLPKVSFSVSVILDLCIWPNSHYLKKKTGINKLSYLRLFHYILHSFVALEGKIKSLLKGKI